MPKTRTEALIFTVITAWIMVYFMTLYNTVLASRMFVNETFFLIAGPIARALFRLLFRRVNGPDEKKIEQELLEEGIAE